MRVCLRKPGEAGPGSAAWACPVARGAAAGRRAAADRSIAERSVVEGVGGVRTAAAAERIAAAADADRAGRTAVGRIAALV
eukprot:scaffold43626_cov17-Tisochrysis_lutea.AAC.2